MFLNFKKLKMSKLIKSACFVVSTQKIVPTIILSASLSPLSTYNRLSSPKGLVKENYKLSQANVDRPLPLPLGPDYR